MGNARLSLQEVFNFRGCWGNPGSAALNSIFIPLRTISEVECCETRISLCISIRIDALMERATGVEPASEAWEASILPMNYARASSGDDHSLAEVGTQLASWGPTRAAGICDAAGTPMLAA